MTNQINKVGTEENSEEIRRLRARVAELEEIEAENRRIQRSLHEQKIIFEMIANGTPLEEVLNTLIKMVEVYTFGLRCSILLLNSQGTHLRFAAAPSLPAEFNAAIDNLEVGPENGCCGAAVYYNRLVIVSDTTVSPLCANFTQLIGAYKLRACWSSPIYGNDNKIIGTFASYYDTPTMPSPFDLKRIEMVTHLAAFAIERKRTDDALHQSEEKNRCLMEAIPQLLWTTNAEGSADFLNQHWTNYTGQSQEEALNMGWLEVIHLEDRERVQEHWREAVNSREHYEVEYRLRRRDGVYRWFLVRGVPLKNEQGQVTGWVGTSTDINDQKELDHLKNLFVSIASHELRTPLTIISGYSQNLKRTLARQNTSAFDKKLADKFEFGLTKIASQTDNCLGLIAQLLDFSRTQSNKLTVERQENVDLAELVQQVIEQQAQVAHNHKLQAQVEVRKAIGSFDKTRLEQVLSNLISNAFKYSPAQTTVTVGMEQREAEVIVWVRDEGFGISPENQAHVFDCFYRERTHETRAVEGLGLGLYISRQIIEQHQGRMWVESQQGKGSTFYFALPITTTSV